jgi:hypothetical protein
MKLETIVDPFSDLTSKSPERRDNVDAETDEKVLRVLDNKYFSESLEERALSPDQINKALRIIIAERRFWGDDQQLYVGDFFTRMVRDSYKIGNNDFVLNVQDKSLVDFGNLLCGTKDKPINIKIYGNVDILAHKAKYCNFHVFGNSIVEIGKGEEAENCNFIIEGDVGTFFGRKSRECNFHIKGNADYVCGMQSVLSNYVIEGNAGHECGAHADRCVFEIKGKMLPGWLTKNTLAIEPNYPSDTKYILHDEETYKDLKRKISILNRNLNSIKIELKK